MNRTKGLFLGSLLAVLFCSLAALATSAFLPGLPQWAAAEATHSFTHAQATALTADGGSLASGNYYLDDDVNLTANITINATDVEICLNGHVLSGSGQAIDGSVITVTNGGSLRIHDCNGTVQNTITVNGAEKTYAGGVITGGTGRLITYVSGGGIRVLSSTFILEGGTIAGNACYAPSYLSSSYGVYGGGVYAGHDAGNYSSPGSTVVINGGMIADNKAELYNTDGEMENVGYGGGGLYVSGGSFTMNGGKICGNDSCRGGGVYLYNPVSAVMNGGEISGNTATLSGGGVEVRGGFTLSGGKISGNVCSCSYAGTSHGGGGVSVTGSFTQTGGEISGNTAVGGSGIYLNKEANGQITVSGGSVKNNIGEGAIRLGDNYDEQYTHKLVLSGGFDISGNVMSTYFANPSNVCLDADYQTSVEVQGEITSPKKTGVYFSQEYVSNNYDEEEYRITASGGYNTSQDPNDIFKCDGGRSTFYVDGYGAVYMTFVVATVEYKGETAKYTDLFEALAAASIRYEFKENDELLEADAVRVTLVADAQINRLLKASSNIIFDLNGHIVSPVAGYSASGLLTAGYSIYDTEIKPTSLIITDSAPDRAHYYAEPYGSPVFDDDVQTGEGVKTISGGLITGSSNFFAISLGTMASLRVCGGTIFANAGGGIHAGNGGVKLYVDGGAIIGNGSDELACGGGIVVSAEVCEINGGVISKNRAIRGGGIFAHSDVTVNGGEISDNFAVLDGGGICTYDAKNDPYAGNQKSPAVFLNGGSIVNNAAGNCAGGIYLFDGVTGLADEEPRHTGIRLCGAPKVTGNCVTGADGGRTESNLYLAKDGVVSFAGALSDGAEIGVTLASDYPDGTFTVGYGDNNTADGGIIEPSAYFTADDPALSVALTALGEAELITTVTLVEISATVAGNGGYKAYDTAELAVTAKFSDDTVRTLVAGEYSVAYPEGQGGKLFAGDNTLTVSYTYTDTRGDTQTRTCDVTVNGVAKLAYDISALRFDDATVVYDGQTHRLEVVGLPAGVTVTYQGNDVSTVGEHTVTATFTGDVNYEPIPDKTATLTITAESGGIPWWVWLIIAIAVITIIIVLFFIFRRKKDQEETKKDNRENNKD